MLFAHFFLRLRLPFVFRTGTSNALWIARSPTLKHVHFAAVCRASCNALSFVRLKGESMRIRLMSLRCRLLSDCPQKQRLNALIGAELPANPMDIACPWSSSWLTVLLI
jgi:hypothetical protein